jgi:hypothetical protein
MESTAAPNAKNAARSGDGRELSVDYKGFAPKFQAANAILRKKTARKPQNVPRSESVFRRNRLSSARSLRRRRRITRAVSLAAKRRDASPNG